jgi:hypothetical protein
MLAPRSASALLSSLPPSRSFGPLNRRRAVRRRWQSDGAQVFANKYIDGFPYAVEVLDASASGLSIRPIAEPTPHAEDADRDGFTLELFVEDRSIFTWAKRVRVAGDGEEEGYRILAVDALDRARFEKFLRTLPQ